MADLANLLRILTERNGSDLHLSAHAAPNIRVDEKMVALDMPVL